MIYYFSFSLICLALCIFEHWLDGRDLRVADLFGMMFMSFFPVMNVLCFIGTLSMTIAHLYGMLPLKGGVLLKGRKNDTPF